MKVWPKLMLEWIETLGVLRWVNIYCMWDVTWIGVRQRLKFRLHRQIVPPQFISSHRTLSTWLWKKGFLYMKLIVKIRSYWCRVGPFDPVWLAFLEKRHIQTEDSLVKKNTKRTPGGDRSRAQGDISASQGFLATPEAMRKGTEHILLRALRRRQPCWCLDYGLLASRAMRG